MQSVNRIMGLLETLGENKNGIGINELSERIGLPLSTTHRLLKALKAKSYVVQKSDTKRYSLGLGILKLSVNLLNEMDVIKVARPFMEELSTKYRQLVYLSVFDDNRVTCVDMVNNNTHNMRYYVKMGTTMPFHCAASAKAIIANLDEKERSLFLANEPREKFTEFTKSTEDEIREDWKMIQDLGYATCDQEMEDEVNALAVPIYGRDGKVFASITILLNGGIISNMGESIASDFKEAGHRVSEFMGYL